MQAAAAGPPSQGLFQRLGQSGPGPGPASAAPVVSAAADLRIWQHVPARTDAPDHPGTDQPFALPPVQHQQVCPILWQSRLRVVDSATGAGPQLQHQRPVAEVAHHHATVQP